MATKMNGFGAFFGLPMAACRTLVARRQPHHHIL
jgi:hypothetical protein